MKRTIAIFILAVYGISCTNPKGSVNDVNKDTLGLDTTALKHSSDPFLKSGEQKTKYPNGVIESQGNYVNGKRDGQWYTWYSTGKPWSENYYENGIKNGPTKTWYDNGKLLYEGQFENDEKAGTWKFYNKDGELSKKVDFSKQ